MSQEFTCRELLENTVKEYKLDYFDNGYILNLS